MKNMGFIISSHNKHILQPNDYKFGCNFRIERECPLENKCLSTNIVYEATIQNNSNDDQKRYLEASETLFKNHTRDYKHQKYKNCTELSKCIYMNAECEGRKVRVVYH